MAEDFHEFTDAQLTALARAGQGRFCGIEPALQGNDSQESTSV